MPLLTYLIFSSLEGIILALITFYLLSCLLKVLVKHIELFLQMNFALQKTQFSTKFIDK